MDVKTAGRTVQIFETFADAKEPLSLSEIARALDAPLSSCLYLVRALEQRGYLYTVGHRKHIYPTRKLFNLGRAIAAGDSWVQQVEPILSELRNSTRETIILGKQQGNRVVYLAVFEGPQTIRYTSAVGDLKPLHSSAIGKALLSALPAAQRKKAIGKMSLEPVTGSTITDREALLAALDGYADQGFAITEGENVVDVMALAQPVQRGQEYYGVAIAGPIYRMKAEVEKHLQSLQDACHELTVLG